MPAKTGLRYGGLGYMSYGVPAQVVSPGIPSPYQPYNSRSYGAPVITQPVAGDMPPLTLAWQRAGAFVASHPVRPVIGRVASGGGPRWVNAVIGIFRPGVSAQSQSSEALGAPQQRAIRTPAGTPGPNSANTPLFGRPGFTYSSYQPQPRIGPVPKLAPGTGRTSRKKVHGRNRGFVPAAYATEQAMGHKEGFIQFDYTPPTDPDFNIGQNPLSKFKTLPRTINVGVDGVTLVGTYRAHDFTPADRFFKQGRSVANWQDMTFGPDYRFLLPRQQVARYNLYNSINLARPLSPNNYFLGYQTQAAISAQIGGTGNGRPLGY